MAPANLVMVAIDDVLAWGIPDEALSTAIASQAAALSCEPIEGREGSISLALTSELRGGKFLQMFDCCWRT